MTTIEAILQSIMWSTNSLKEYILYEKERVDDDKVNKLIFYEHYIYVTRVTVKGSIKDTFTIMFILDSGIN